MINNNTNKKKIGLNGHQCIGPCYKAGKYITHPITLKTVNDNLNPFCPTMSWKDANNNELWIDECLVPDDVSIYTTDEKLLDYLIPTFGLTCDMFLKDYYKIFSFENAIDWIINNKEPYYTHMRIINCAWKIYGLSVDVFNEQLIEFYRDIIKKKWIKYLYVNIAKYIYVENNKIYLKENNDSINENKIEKINFFNKKFNTPQIIYKMLQLYVDENRSRWEDIIDHNENIKQHYLDYIINKIKNNI